MRFSTFVVATVLACILAALQPAYAETFDFSYSFSGSIGGGGSAYDVSGSGTLITSALDTSTDAYTILSVTGTRNYMGESQTITGLIPVNGFQGNDDLLFASGPTLDEGGFSFSVNGPGDASYGVVTSNVNVGYYSASMGTSGYSEGDPNVGYGMFQITEVPEASPFVSFGSLLLCGLTLFYRYRREA